MQEIKTAKEKVRIRKAILKDKNKIYQILKKPRRDAYTNQLIIDLIKNKKSICLVATFNKKIVGCIGARREGYKAYWIYFIDVTKKFRNHKIGTALMNKLLERARELKADKIAIDTPNKRFPLKVGFKIIGKLPKWQAKNKTQYIMFKKLK